MKQSIFAVLILVLATACKKDNSAPDLGPLTTKNTEALVNTEWYGLYQNAGEAGIGNNNGYRGFALALRADSLFTFYGTGFKHEGIWTIHADTAFFRFTEGSKNRWWALLKNDSSFAGVSVPSPANFSLDKNIKKIAAPPTDVIRHKWTEYTRPGISAFALNDLYVEFKESVTMFLFYDFPPVKSKIFSVTTGSAPDFSKLVIVDGKIAWIYNGSGYNYKYNY